MEFVRCFAGPLKVGVAFFACLLFFSLSTSCRKQDAREVNIPEGRANDTLKEFARQAEVEIIFDAKSVVGVETNAVAGILEPHGTLGRMVAGTPLLFEQDPETGAFAVFRTPVTDAAERIPADFR